MATSGDYLADLHTHSRYAYACSKNLNLTGLAETARLKGIQLLATGDFTHPAWLSELESGLEEVDYGTFRHGGVSFVLGTEISCVFKQGGKTRRIHLLVYLTSFDSVRRFSGELARLGARLGSDGRPTARVGAADLTALTLDLDPDAMIIPAHIWTPWYGILGSVSGFDSLEECFGDVAPLVAAVETGLSSDPAMNWAIPQLEDRTIVSFSDAHSLPNLGRESTVFRGKPTYPSLKEAVLQNEIAYTVEFYPEQGKYHINGHRKCGVSQTPLPTMEQSGEQSGAACPACGRPMTLGVLHRVQSLSPHQIPREEMRTVPAEDGLVRHAAGRPPFMRLVQLADLLGDVLNAGPRTKKVQNVLRKLCDELGSEMEVLARADEFALTRVAGEPVAEAILKARRGQVSVEPGFDGQYGTVRVL